MVHSLSSQPLKKEKLDFLHNNGYAALVQEFGQIAYTLLGLNAYQSLLLVTKLDVVLIVNHEAEPGAQILIDTNYDSWEALKSWQRQQPIKPNHPITDTHFDQVLGDSYDSFLKYWHSRVIQENLPNATNGTSSLQELKFEVAAINRILLTSCSFVVGACLRYTTKARASSNVMSYYPILTELVLSHPDLSLAQRFHSAVLDASAPLLTLLVKDEKQVLFTCPSCRQKKTLKLNIRKKPVIRHKRLDILKRTKTETDLEETAFFNQDGKLQFTLSKLQL